MKKMLVIHGPNLNLLGEREPGVYGTDTFESINMEITAEANKYGYECEIFQSNYEGAIIDKLHQSRKNCCGIIINAGAYTHYSYAIRDAISAIKIPCIEVHLSNVDSREDFRQKSVIGSVCTGQISGFGKYSYLLAIKAMTKMVSENG